MGKEKIFDVSRPQTSPTYERTDQNITGLDQWGWGDYGGGGDWWEGTGTDPASVPDPIGGGGTYGLASEGIDVDNPDLAPLTGTSGQEYWPTADPLGTEAYGDIRSAYGQPIFDPMGTAERDWKLDYNIGDTGYSFAGANPYQEFPWIEDGWQGEFKDGGTGGTGGTDDDAAARAAAAAAAAEAERARIAAEEAERLRLARIAAEEAAAARKANLFNTGEATDGFPAVEVADIDPEVEGMDVDVTNAPYPYTLPQAQTVGNIPVGDDPISNWFNSALLRMGQQGGRVPTDLEAQTGNALSQILSAGGGGGALETPFGEGMQSELEDLITNYGAIPADAQRAAIDFEQARSPLDAMRQAQLSQGQAALASRNILGQGPELDFMERLEERLAPAYSAAGQRLITDQLDRADTRYQAALDAGGNLAEAQAQRREERLIPTLQIASNQTESQARNMLATVQTWTDRQQMLGDLAIRNLDQNIDWNKFLANFGLERDQMLEMISSGRLDELATFLNSNLNALGIIPQGMVPYGIESS
jgi:hypothetical protein